MKRVIPFAAVAFISLVAAAGAQTPSQDEHAGHHPADPAPAGAAPAAPPGQMEPGRMQSGQIGMGGDMGRMMCGMHGGAMMRGALGRFTEGRLAFLKTELTITQAQAPQWSTFADAYRSVAQSAKGSHMQAMMGGNASAPDRLAGYEKHLAARLDAVRKLKAAVDPLYAVLSADQKKLADELLGHVGMM